MAPHSYKIVPGFPGPCRQLSPVGTTHSEIHYFLETSAESSADWSSTSRRPPGISSTSRAHLFPVRSGRRLPTSSFTS
eukprot:1341891-Pyramimonas_sp.AAC.1